MQIYREYARQFSYRHPNATVNSWANDILAVTDISAQYMDRGWLCICNPQLQLSRST